MAAKGGQWKGQTFVPAKATKLVDRAMWAAGAQARLHRAALDAEFQAQRARSKGERARWMQRAHHLQRKMEERGATRDRVHRVLERRSGQRASIEHSRHGHWNIELAPAGSLRPSDARARRASLGSTIEDLEARLRERKDHAGRAIGDHAATVLRVKVRRARAGLAAHDERYDSQGLALGREKEQLRAAMADSKERLPALRAEREARRGRRNRVHAERARRAAMRARVARVDELRAERDLRRTVSADRRTAVEKARAERGTSALQPRPVLPTTPGEVARAMVSHDGKHFGVVVSGNGSRGTGAHWYAMTDSRWHGARPPRSIENKLRRALRKQGIKLAF